MYGAAATWRRRWYAHDPARRRHLACPVISVGNLRSGGSGKTPIVAHLARLLHDRGERPAVLSRGYARTRPSRGVTVVSDGRCILTGLAESGDEPLMLARALPGVAVLVATDRFLAGQRAERELGVTVHLLDDGFQHLRLARDVDLVLVDEGDLVDRVLPMGRLREPLANVRFAHAVLTTASDPGTAGRIAHALQVPEWFRMTRSLGPPRYVAGEPDRLATGPVFAVAGIARPDRFFADLSAAGYDLAGTMAFADHYAFTQQDADRIGKRAEVVGAATLLTTEKDGVRIEGLTWRDLAVAAVPLTATIEPADRFMAWLIDRLALRPSRAPGKFGGSRESDHDAPASTSVPPRAHLA